MKRRNYTLVELIVTLFMICNFILFVFNIVHLVNCDWKKGESWKGEIVHSLGVVTPIYLVTGWANFDDK